MQARVREIEVARPMREYLAKILVATRSHPDLELGVSSRGGVHLQRAAQAMAAMKEQSFLAPEQVKAVAPHVLAHRVIQSAGSSGPVEGLIEEIVNSVPAPI